MSKYTEILIIDDEQVVLDAVKRVCAAEKYRVQTALNSREAFARMSKKEFDLIICDLLLPEIDGFRVLETLNAKHIDTPVIIITGYSTMENAVKSLNKGAIDFVPKPFTADELSSAIRRGIKYCEIRAIEQNGAGGTITHVPCPQRYFRLGNNAWIWQDQRGDVVTGVTDFYVKTIGSIESIELSNVQDHTIQGNYCATFRTHDGLSHPLLAAISGSIIEVNVLLQSSPSLVEKDPYFKGWLYRLIPTDLNYEMKNLISCRQAML